MDQGDVIKVQDESLGGARLEVKSATDEAQLGAPAMAELVSAGAASEALSALQSLAAQAGHQDQLDKDAMMEPSADGNGGENSAKVQPAFDRNEAHQQASTSSDDFRGDEAPADAPSPASSSADAPGSDYDEGEQRSILIDVSMLADVQKEESSTANLAEQSTPDPISVNKPEAIKFERRNDGEMHRVKEVEIGFEQEQSPQPAAPILEDQQVAIQSASAEQHDEQGLSLMVDTIYSEIEHKAAEAEKDPQNNNAADENAGRESTPVQVQAVTYVAVERPESRKLLSRPAEDDDAAISSKRQKLNDSVSTPDPPAPITKDDTATAPEKKQPVKKTAKAPAKPKALPKPKKEPKAKAKGKKAIAKAEPEQPDTKPDSLPVPSDIVGTETAAGASHDAPVDPDQTVPPPGQEPVAQTKKTRKTPARPRKKPVKIVAPVPDELPLNQAPIEASSANSAPIDSLLTHEGPRPEASQQTPAVSEPVAKLKAKRKPKAPSKAKDKAKAVPTDSFEGSPSATTPLVPIALPPRYNLPPQKYSMAKEGKGRIAQLRPAQADGAISELELEPAQQLPSIASFNAEPGCSRKAATLTETDARGSIEHAGHGNAASYRVDPALNSSQQGPMAASAPAPPSHQHLADSNIFISMPPPQYPAQAHWPTRAELVQQQNRALSSLTSAVSMLESEVREWSEGPAGSAVADAYATAQEAKSPATTVANAASLSVAGDDVSDATCLSPTDSSFSKWEPDPTIHPPGWRLPHFDVIDPEVLMTTMRNNTVWTFWDCYLPLGCRDQDLVIVSNDNMAFPCAAWNPCLFSDLFRRVIKNPSRIVSQILHRSVEENRQKLGYKPLACIWIDENWHSTNLLLSFVHPIPSMFLPDRTTCRIVMDLGLRYGVERAVNAARQRTYQLDEEDRADKDKGKGRAREEDLAADVADGAAFGSRE